MAMPAPSSAPPPYYPPRRGCGSGCLWGCLILVAIISLPMLLAGGFGTWFLWGGGYKNNATLRVVGELVRKDGLAQQVLGQDAQITGVRGNTFSWMPGVTRNAYEVELEGPKGEGELAVTAHSGFKGPELDSVILTGPDGRRYDLLKHQLLPRGDSQPDTSI